MELNLEATGGASDFSRQAELDSSQLNFDLESWDDGYVDLERNSQPHFGADSEHYSPSVSEPAESHVALQLSQYRDYNFQNSLRDAAFNNSTTLPDLPWESSLWKCIFDDEYDPLDAINPEKPLTGPSPPFVPRDGDELKDALIEKKRSLLPLDKKLPIYTVAVGHRRDISWEDKREADFQRGLKKWTSIVLSWPEEWSVCKAMQECESLVQVCEQLGHYFVGKAPATLIKRANSMIYIMEQGHKLGYIFPYTEQDLYALLKVLKNTGQTASRLKGVMEALTFCRYIFNIEDLQTLIVSKRCYGAISGGPVNRANQAAPLSVRDLVCLHETLESSEDIWDCMMAGAALFCIYSRARWSDFVHCGKLKLDRFSDGTVAYVDADVAIHKTMHAAARRFRFLNLTAPALGVHGSEWVSKWISTMERLGIDPFSDDSTCLMPAPDSEGRPLVRAIESDEAGCWLRLLIGEEKSRHDSLRQISSHSMKATMLSYAAKRGYSHQDRLSLGHHVHPYQMADVYARDAAARDLRLLDALIKEIREGVFRPDESRAGRLDNTKRQRVEDVLDETTHFSFPPAMPSADVPENFEVPEPVSNEPDLAEGGSDDEVDGGHVTTDSSSSESEQEERQRVHRQFDPPQAPSGFVFVQHQRSKLLHLISVDNQRALACGRLKNAAYAPPQLLRYDSAVCHACQRATRRD